MASQTDFHDLLHRRRNIPSGDKGARMSPMARCFARLRDLSYHGSVVEYWNPFAKIRQDLFVADILALKDASRS